MFSSEGISAQNNNTPITAGPLVGVTLVSVVKDDKGGLKFNFKGTDPSNSGVFTHQVFAIDTTHPNYKEENQKRVMAQILHIASRFTDEDTARKTLNGTTWDQYADAIVKFFTSFAGKNIPLKAKITLRESNGKYYNQFPMFPNFLSSEKYPTQFSTSAGYDIYVPATVTDKPDNMNKVDDSLPF